MNDYSCYNAVFVDGLKTFLDYTTPHAFDNAVTNGLIIRRRLQKDDFEKRCIQRWAISELMNLIVNNPQDPVEDTTYKFALELLSFAAVSTNASMRKVFHIAADFIDKRLSVSSERRRECTREEVFLATFSTTKKTQTKTQGGIGGV